MSHSKDANTRELQDLAKDLLLTDNSLLTIEDFEVLEVQTNTTLDDIDKEDIDSLARCYTCGATSISSCTCSISPGLSEQMRISEENTPSDIGQVINARFTTPQPITVSEERKQRRKQQNRVAQEKYREKHNRILNDALQKIKVLEAELASMKSQREHFRLLYEDLETQLLEARSGYG